MEDDLKHAAESASAKNIQQVLIEIREKITRSVALIAALREDKARLAAENARLQEELVAMKKEAAEHAASHAADIEVGDGLLYLSVDEREALERQISELLERIDSHLR